MKLIITEKPSVARDIAKILKVTGKKEGYIEGNGYLVTWAIGHLITLVNPESYDKKYKSWKLEDLPILPETFKIEQIKTKGAKEQFKVIKNLIAKTDIKEIICATDAGREGELIFRLIYDHAKATAPIKRLWISSQTDKAILTGFENLKPGEDYQSLYDSALSRSQADWLIGMNATRAYSIALSKGNGVMSVGRVQTPVLNMIVERFEEHNKFEPQTFFEIFADIKHDNGGFESKWFFEKDDRFSDEQKAKDTLEAVTANPTGTIQKLTAKQKKENPPLLYDLTEVQKEANRRFKFSADRTLKVMQSLYERHKVLTYPRTASRYISEDIVPKLPDLFKNLTKVPAYKVHAEFVLSEKLRISKRIVDDKKVTDHHAIIPTDKTPEIDNFSTDEAKIYDMVIRRFLAAFFPQCIKDTTEIISEFGGHTFKVSGTVIKVPGWRGVYSVEAKEETTAGDKKKDKKAKKETLLPIVKEGDSIRYTDLRLQEGQTKPPALYNEASILSAMETAGRQVDDEDMREAMKDCGLGTPATRAQILERLISVGYINREQNRLIPTDKGIYLIENIQDKELLSPKLTGDWEKKLNDMAQGNFKREDYMAGIASFTSKVVETVKNTAEGGDLEGQDPIGLCPICKKGEVFETMKTFTCSEKSEENCDFTIWKMIAKKAITKSIATTLVKDGTTKLITGFKSRAGKFFDASLEIKEGKISFNFDREPVGDCPVCDDGKIIVTSRAFSCSNWKEKSCPFTIWKVIAGKQISEGVVLALAAEGKVEEISGFKSRAGKHFSAGLELIEGKAQLIFKDKE